MFAFLSDTFRASEEFNNAVVLTSRYLKPNELLEVRVDIQMTKWAGSLEIGVTTHDPEKLDFPTTMTNVQPPGTWMMSGGSIVCDGVTVIENYGPTLDEIKVEMHWSSFFTVLICWCWNVKRKKKDLQWKVEFGVELTPLEDDVNKTLFVGKTILILRNHLFYIGLHYFQLLKFDTMQNFVSGKHYCKSMSKK